MEANLEDAFVRLTEADIDDVMAFAARVYDRLPDKRWYYLSDREEFLDSIRRGWMIGLRKDGRLIAMADGATGEARRAAGSHDYATAVGDPVADTFDFLDMMVDPGCRRMGIHTAVTVLFRRQAEALGCRAMYCTIDPDNVPCRRCMEKAGYEAVTQQPAYDGRPRVYYRLKL